MIRPLSSHPLITISALALLAASATACSNDAGESAGGQPAAEVGAGSEPAGGAAAGAGAAGAGAAAGSATPGAAAAVGGDPSGAAAVGTDPAAAGAAGTDPGAAGTDPGSAGAGSDPAAGGDTGAGADPGGAAGADTPVGTDPAAGADPGADPAPATDPALPAGVSIIPEGAAFEGQIDVTLTSEAADAEIRYTTDGTAPTASSELYAGVMTLTDTTQLRAQAFVAGAPSGGGAGGVFVARAFDASSDMPIVIVDGYGAGKPAQKAADGSWITNDAAFLVFEPVDGAASLSQAPTLATRSGYHVRGQSSASFEKAPYKVEIWDELNADRKLPVLGMPEQSDWALVGPFYDRSMIRHAFMYDLGREMGLQAPRFAFAEVYLNHDGGPLEQTDYEGIYMVVETIKNAKQRLDLKKLDETDTTEPDISGGYIFKFDWRAASEPMLTCDGAPIIEHAFGECPVQDVEQFPASTAVCEDAPGGISGGFGGGGGGGGAMMPPVEVDPEEATCWADLEVVDPAPLSQVQQDWLTAYVTDFNDTLHQSPIGAYADYIDVASFVDTFLLNELSRNGDAYVRSVYFHKDRDQKIVAGPLWDFNLIMAVGGSIFCNSNPEGWAYEFRSGSNDWFQRLIADPAFRTLVVARWQELRQGPLSQAALEQRVAALSAPMANAVAREYERWPLCSLTGQIFAIPEGDTWDAQLQVMRDFMQARGAWMDSQLQ